MVRPIASLRFLLTVIPAFVIFISVAEKSSGQEAPPGPGEHDSLIVAHGDGKYSIDNVYIDKQERLIVTPGYVNQQDGLVEYLAVTPGGKTHESALVLDIRPMHLQLALLLLGLDYGRNVTFQGDTTMPAGDSVIITASWVNADGDSLRYDVSELIKDLRTGAAMAKTTWVFTGSLLDQGVFLADLEGSIIATYSDPAAILNHIQSGRYDDTVYGANDAILPPKGTRVRLTYKIP